MAMTDSALPTLHEIGIKHGTDKAVHHDFMQFYEKRLGHLRYEKFNFLEIGYYRGQSISAWLEYFQYAEIYCIDKRGTKFRHERFHFDEISQDNPLVRNLYPDEFFTVIIDDGSHMTGHQLQALYLLWPKVANGGFYIVEDISTSFIDKYIDTSVTTYQWLNGMSLQNLDNIRKDIEAIEIFQKNPSVFNDSMTSIIRKK